LQLAHVDIITLIALVYKNIKQPTCDKTNCMWVVSLINLYYKIESVHQTVIKNKYKQSTKQALFFFDAQKEPKKLLGGCESPQTPERFMV